MRKEAHEKVVIDIEKAPSVFLAKMSGIVIPEELAQPMKIPLKFILNQFHRGTCEPVVLTDDNVLVDGIRQYKVAKLLKWEKIPAIFEDNKTFVSLSDLNKASEIMEYN